MRSASLRGIWHCIARQVLENQAYLPPILVCCVLSPPSSAQTALPAACMASVTCRHRPLSSSFLHRRLIARGHRTLSNLRHKWPSGLRRLLPIGLRRTSRVHMPLSMDGLRSHARFRFESCLVQGAGPVGFLFGCVASCWCAPGRQTRCKMFE